VNKFILRSETDRFLFAFDFRPVNDMIIRCRVSTARIRGRKNMSRLFGRTTASAIALSVAMPVFAQAITPAAPTAEACDADPDLKGCVVRRNADGSRATRDEIVVTGSRIPRPEIDGVLPGVQVGGEQIRAVCDQGDSQAA
jgi:hypothetical protein